MSYAEQSPRGGAADSYYQQERAEGFYQPWGVHGDHPEAFPSPPNVPLPVSNGVQSPPYASVPYPQGKYPQPPYPQDSPGSVYPQSPPVYNPSPIKPESSDKLSFNEAFLVEKPKWNDIWATVLFTLVSIGFLVVSGFAFSGYQHEASNADTISLNAHTIVCL